jgi:hypothetical protein
MKPWQIEEVLKHQGEDMTDRYMRLLREKRYSSALEDCRALLRCIVLKNVFMATGLKERFQALHGMTTAALVELKVGYDYPAQTKFDAYSKLVDEGKRQYAELEALVRERLWSVQ